MVTDLLGGFAVKHIRDRHAAEIEETLDIKEIGGLNDLEQHLEVNLYKILIPFSDFGGVTSLGLIVGGLVLQGRFDDGSTTQGLSSKQTC